MRLSCIELTPTTIFDNLLCVRFGGQPKEALSKDFGYEGPGSGVMPAITFVDLSKYLNAFLLRNALLKYSIGASLVELSIDYCVGLCSSYDLPP